MREFWDQRAREDAFFFVDNRRAYGVRRPDDFWTRGEDDLETILSLLGAGVGPADVVVDVGCGVGRLTRPLAARAKWVYGIDVSPQMIQIARAQNRHLPNVEWIVGDGVSLRPIGPSSVDVCLSHVVFQHIPDPRITLGYVQEMGRVLRPGGWAAFQVSTDPSVHERPRSSGGAVHRLRGLIGRAARGQNDPAWLGSAVQLDALRAAGEHANLDFERVVGRGTQFCLILARRDGV